MPTSCSHYFKETIIAAERAGVDGDLLLANTGLTREQINQEDWRGDVELLARLIRLVWYALNDEFMGLLSPPSKPGTFAMMTYCVIDSRTIEDAIRKGILFYDLNTDALKMSLHIKGDTTRFVIKFKHPELDPNYYFHDFWLSIWYRLVGWMGRVVPPIKLVTFSFPRPVNHAAEYKLMFPCPHEFDADETAIHFNTGFLRRPFDRTREELKQLLLTAPLDFLMVPKDEMSYAKRVGAVLRSKKTLPLNFPHFGEIAEEFHMTPRTLHRKLEQELSSYRLIQEDIRRDIAINKLIEDKMQIKEVAFLLGYSELRAFTRAFKRWTGYSPVQYKTRLREQFPSGARPSGE